jgi:hypothetical protein
MACPAPKQSAASNARYFNTLKNVHIAGFQGWFTCPPAAGGYGHWTSSYPPTTSDLAVDVWPRTAAFPANQLCSPLGFNLNSGAPAQVYDDTNPAIVNQQFLWMQQYGIDGVAIQRFAEYLDGDGYEQMYNTVMTNAWKAAEVYQRGFYIAYDGISSATIPVIEADWNYLTQTLKITDSPSYIFHRGRPVVELFGLGASDRPTTLSDAAELINFFRKADIPATIIGGVPAHWRTLGGDSQTDPAWTAVYESYDVISPWTVGRFVDDSTADAFYQTYTIPDIALTKSLGIDYMPVLYPGFSFHNAGGSTYPLDQIPRRCGDFYQHQATNALNAGANMLYTAMFDEYNEATAISMSPTDPAELPAGIGMVIYSEDCPSATPDMYLILAGKITAALRSQP